MSVAAQPPITPPNTPPGRPRFSTAAALPPQNKSAPMRNLPPIPRATSVAEAQSIRNEHYVPPEMMPGEVVFYRRKSVNDETLAMIVNQQNKSFSMYVFGTNNIMTLVNSVDYWDHTEADPQQTGDPMAGHHSNGTFRRSPFGKVVLELFGKLAGQSLEKDNKLETMNTSFTAALVELTEQLDALKERLAAVEATAKKQK